MAKKKLTCIVSQPHISTAIKTPKIGITTNFSVVKVSGDIYEGEYDVTPECYEQIVLKTENKSMVQDVTVRKIPFESVSNPEGGYTVTIGGY